MLIAYSKGIEYDPERSDDSERQKLVSNIANALDKDAGEINLIKPEQVNISYNLQSGEVAVKSKVGSVDNTFPELEKQITQPVQEAISLKAKIALLEKLAALSDNKIAERIRINHGKSCEENLTQDAVDNTLRQIQRLGSRGIGFFFGSENKTPTQLKVSNALKDVKVENIQSMENVEQVLKKIDVGYMPKAAPSGLR